MTDAGQEFERFDAPRSSIDGYGVFSPLVSEPLKPTKRNRDHLATLSFPERTAWTAALIGTSEETFRDGEFDLGMYGDAEDGCWQEAEDRAFGDLRSLRLFEDELARLEVELAADERMHQAQADWRDCLHLAGFDLGADGAPIDLVTERYGSFADEIGLADLVRSNIGAATAPRNWMRAPDRHKLDELHAWELQLNRADTQCREDVAAAEDAVIREYEASFLETHQSTLNAIGFHSVDSDS